MNALLFSANNNNKRFRAPEIESARVDNSTSVMRTQPQLLRDFASKTKDRRQRKNMQTRVHKLLDQRFWNQFTPAEWEDLRRMEDLAGLLYQPGYTNREVNWDMPHPAIARIAPSRTRFAVVGRARSVPVRDLVPQL